jgi:predicted PurR-regulated permease PerM
MFCFLFIFKLISYFFYIIVSNFRFYLKLTIKVFNNNKIKYIIYILFIVLYIFCNFYFSDPVLSQGNNLSESINSTKEVNVTDNNTNNVEKPDLHVHNPNVNLPSSVGTAISSLGASGAVSAGIYALSQGAKRGSMPITAKAGMVALGGGIGGVLFVGTSAVNT